jgi:hypothetical protein
VLGFASRQPGKPASRLDFADLDATVIGAFLDHLERDHAACLARAASDQGQLTCYMTSSYLL